MARRARVDRTPEEKTGDCARKSGNIAETCRRYEVAPNLYYRWKDEALQGASAALGGRSAAAVETAVGTLPGAKGAGNRNPKKRRGGVSCGEVHSQARELVEQGYERKLVATVLAISRSSLYYRKRARGSRADRRWDSQIVAACGIKPAYGYRLVAW